MLALVQDFCLGNVILQGMTYKDEPVFSAFEVARILGYENPHEAVSDHCVKQFTLKYKEVGDSVVLEANKIKGLSTHNGITLIKEADLYRLILRSRLESAVLFQDWVCEIVLPTIRKTGSYSLNQNALEVQTKLQIENEKLKEERNELIARLHKSTHNRISTFCKNEETGKMELTSKDKKLVDIHAKYSGQYILDCCSLSQTLYSMQAFGVPFPDDFYLKDGRLFKSIYTEPCCDEKPLKSMEFAKIINNNAQDIFDFC